MSLCVEVQELLPWYVNETLEPDERTTVACHLERCDECAAALVDWRQVAYAMPAVEPVDRAVAVAPASEVAPIASGVRAPARLSAREIVALARVQARLLPWGLWPAVAMVLALGVAIVLSSDWPAHDVLGVLAPLLAAVGVSLACTEGNDPRKEIALASPLPARLVLLTRLVLVVAYDFLLALAASAVLAAAGGQTLGPLIGVWLAPMLALSGAALLATVVLEPGIAVAIAFGLWALRWVGPVDPGAEVLIVAAVVCLFAAAVWIQVPVDRRRLARPGVG